MHGKLVSIKPSALQKKRDIRNAVALDSEQNPIQNRDIVKVIEDLILEDKEKSITYSEILPFFIHAKC